jgi:hypothetical protein
MKTLATYKIDFDVEREMISYYKKTEVDSKLSSLSSSVNTSIDSINSTLDQSVRNVKASDNAGYVTVLYNNGETREVVVGSPTDAELDSNSTNPVQNKAVNAALKEITECIDTTKSNTSTESNIFLSVTGNTKLVAPKRAGQLAYIQNDSTTSSVNITYNSSSTITIPVGGLEIFVSKGTSWVPFKISQVYIN